MDITLRKADSLHKTALEYARRMLTDGNIEVSIYEKEPVANLMKDARQKTLEVLKEAVALQGAAFRIRDLAGDMMDEVGINTILRERKQLDIEEASIMQVLGERSTKVLTAPPMAEAIQARIAISLDRAQKAERTLYGVENEVKVDCLLKEDVIALEKRLAEIRKRKRGMDEDLLTRNMRKFTLPEEAERIFNRYALL